MTLRERAQRMLAAGQLSTGMKLQAVALGLLQASEVPELATQVANAATIRQQASAALTTNKTFLAIASPTTAQTLAQVKALTRQNQALIRLALQLLDGTD